MLKNLSDLGMGNRDTMEDVIEQEVEQIAESFKQKKSKPMNSRV